MGMQASTNNSWIITAGRGNRLDWSVIRDRIDLAAVATALLGAAPGRRGEGGRRLWWTCPFHDDRNPSFAVEPGKPWWRCFGCGEHGDAAALVMKVQSMTFPEAVRWLAERAGIATPSSRPWPPSGRKPIRPRPPDAGPAKAPEKPARQSSGLPLADALKLVEDAAERIWTPEGRIALDYLRRRGLTDETIRQARLGWAPKVSIPVKDGIRYWRVSGIVIPWMDRARLAMVKIRRRTGEEPKYAEAYRDRRSIFPTPEAVHPGKPLVIVEGEFDALLLGQELRELAAVVTLGSASAKAEAPTLFKLLAAAPWCVATDADDAGDRSAEWWPAGAIRVRPPVGKNWTEAAQAGVDLRRWWTGRLKGIEAAPPDPAPWKVSPSGDVEQDTQSPSGTEAPAASMPWPPRPDELASWPLAWRERWGALANHLEARGTSWPQSEAESFRRVKAEMEAGASAVQVG